MTQIYVIMELEYTIFVATKIASCHYLLRFLVPGYLSLRPAQGYVNWLQFMQVKDIVDGSRGKGWQAMEGTEKLL